MIGKTLSHYQITSQIGKGGMGEVYVAYDISLDRKVALKFLPDAFTGDPERMARFEREAKLLASLNHPNIAAIYELEQAEGKRFLVLELVEGETLAQRLTKGPLPIEEALDICRQIAEGLEAAHEKGVIHRDLKPANVMIAAGDKIKILDFGLAKALADETQSVDSSQSPTITEAMTHPGVILGTAAYMSPEQAKGKAVDKRADIWAFGCILYECLTGKRVFEGETVTETLAAVLTRDPEWEKVPANVRPMLRRCLDKEPKKRLRDIGDAYTLLESAPKSVPAKRPWLWVAWSVAAVLAVALCISLWSSLRATQSSDQPLVQFDVDLGPDVWLGAPSRRDIAISPDGKRLVFVSKSRLFTRPLDQQEAIELFGEEGVHAPFFSPDCRWVAFFTRNKLMKIAVEGGAPIALCNAASPGGGSWGEDGTIVAALDFQGPLFRIPSGGGEPTPLTELVQGEAAHRWPQILPGGKALLFITYGSSSGISSENIEVMSFKDHRRKTLQRGGTYGQYLPSGHLVYINKGTLFAVPFDLDQLAVHGIPIPMMEKVASRFDVSRGGMLVYCRGERTGGLVTLQWLDDKGKTQPLPTKPGLFLRPHLSPDGRLLVLNATSRGETDLWIYDWQRDAMTRLTFGDGLFTMPVWSSDGRFVAFKASGRGIFWIRADGTTKPQPLIQSKYEESPFSFSPDGKRLAYAEDIKGKLDLWTVPVKNEDGKLQAGKPEVFLNSSDYQVFPAFSPDGRWIAYMSRESGRFEIYVRSFPDKGGKWQISSNGGAFAIWSRNGHELFYRTADQQIMVVNYTAKGDSFVADKPRLWAEKNLADTNFVQNFDVAPDGKRVVGLFPAEGSEEQKAQSHVMFLLNFFDELRRRLPTGAK